MPLGAMIARRDIVDAVVQSGGFMHGYTYAGNPLACAAGLAVIKEIFDKDLMANTTRIGALLKSRLEGLTAAFPFIGDVRGKGLLLAFELVSDRETMAPLPKELSAFATDETHVDEIIQKLAKSLRRLAAELKLPVNG